MIQASNSTLRHWHCWYVIGNMIRSLPFSFAMPNFLFCVECKVIYTSSKRTPRCVGNIMLIV